MGHYDPTTFIPDIIINQHKIITTNSVKYLGVNFNNKLNQDKHYNLLTQSTTHSYSILIKYDYN